MLVEELLRIPRQVEETADWRHRPANRYTHDGLALVSKVRAEGRDLKAAVREAVDLIGGVRRALSPGDRVLLKPNFNSADPPPASTDLAFLAAIVELLREEGITDLIVGERSGYVAMPTAGVLEKTGFLALARDLALPYINFELGPWMDVAPGEGARWWDRIAYHRSLREFDRIVFLPCLKHHGSAGFTMSLKLPVGMIHPADLVRMHANVFLGRTGEPMHEKMPELSLAVGPDLILMDGRKAFVTGGPARGEMVEPGFLLASGDRIALDVEGVKILQQYPRENLLQAPAWDLPVIRRAVELGLGSASEAEYRVLVAG